MVTDQFTPTEFVEWCELEPQAIVHENEGRFLLFSRLPIFATLQFNQHLSIN